MARRLLLWLTVPALLAAGLIVGVPTAASAASCRIQYADTRTGTSVDSGEFVFYTFSSAMKVPDRRSSGCRHINIRGLASFQTGSSGAWMRVKYANSAGSWTRGTNSKTPWRWIQPHGSGLQALAFSAPSFAWFRVEIRSGQYNFLVVM